MTVYKHIRKSLYAFCEFQVRNCYSYEVEMQIENNTLY